MSRMTHSLPSLVVVLCLLVSPLLADDSGNIRMAQASPQKSAPRAQRQPPVVLDREVEQSVMDFVREHHPELADLLSHLKESRPREYQKAMRDLARVRERLQQLQRADTTKHDLELSIWKTESRIQLLAARVQMGGGDDLRDQLREALDNQVDLRRDLLRHERELLSERLRRIDAQLEKLDQQRSQTIKNQLEMLTRPAGETNARSPAKGSKRQP